jgi:cytochrome c-type biogenesis protein CcmH/NrfF
VRRLAAVALAAGVLAAGVLLAGAVEGQAPSFQELEESLTCQCGCGLTVHSCNHLQCPSALPLREEIREQMKLGLGKDAILAHFADKYGEKILSSPTTSGFNLAAWIMPFFAVSLGAVFVVFTLLRWRRPKGAAPVPAPARSAPGPGGAASAHEKILERELDQFES